MAVVGTKAWTALSTIGLSTGSRPLLLVVVVVAAPQLLADRHVRDTHMTRPLANQWDVAAGTFSSAAEQMMRMPNSHTYNGRNCRSDDAANADGRARSLSDADDGKRNGNSSGSNARDRWVWNASSLCNARGGKRVRHSVD